MCSAPVAAHGGTVVHCVQALMDRNQTHFLPLRFGAPSLTYPAEERHAWRTRAIVHAAGLTRE